MAEQEVTFEHRMICVRAAIGRCKEAERQWKAVEGDPASSSVGRQMARARFKDIEAEFGWQWRNVEQILARFEAPAAAVIKEGKV